MMPSFNTMESYHQFPDAILRSRARCVRVTHPYAGDPEGPPWLACIKPAASVHPEPGSNSSSCSLWQPKLPCIFTLLVVNSWLQSQSNFRKNFTLSLVFYIATCLSMNSLEVKQFFYKNCFVLFVFVCLFRFGAAKVIRLDLNHQIFFKKNLKKIFNPPMWPLSLVFWRFYCHLCSLFYLPIGSMCLRVLVPVIRIVSIC
jgi:hypothetical protein